MVSHVEDKDEDGEEDEESKDEVRDKDDLAGFVRQTENKLRGEVRKRGRRVGNHLCSAAGREEGKRDQG